MPSRHCAVAPGGGLSLAAGRQTVLPAVFTYVPFGHPVAEAGGEVTADVTADVLAGAAAVATRATVVDVVEVDVVLVVVDVVLVDVEVVVASSVVDGPVETVWGFSLQPASRPATRSRTTPRRLDMFGRLRSEGRRGRSSLRGYYASVTCPAAKRSR